jgi:hypothetical protein
MELHEKYGPEARYAVEREAELPTTKWDEEVARGLELGLPGADSLWTDAPPRSRGASCPTSPASTPIEDIVRATRPSIMGR